MTTSPSITSGQEKQITRFAQDALDRGLPKALATVAPDQDGMQRVIEHGDEFQARIETAIETALRELSTTNQYANEEVPSTYGYLSGYIEPKSVAEQVAILREHFPVQLGQADPWVSQKEVRPEGAEGWFAIPRWQTLAPSYNQAVELVLDVLKKARKGKLENYRKGQLGSDRLRETDRKRLAFERISEEQAGHDVLVVAAQFGLRHRGRSVRRARAVMGGREFGLGAFEGLIMLLTHADRLKHYDDLWLDFAGDEYSPDADGGFGRCPGAGFGGGRVEFGTYWFGYAYDGYGSVSAFLSQ